MVDLARLVARFGGTLGPDMALEVEGSTIEVSFANGRRQRIVMSRAGDAYTFESRVLSASRVDEIPTWADLAKCVWERNRTTPLVAFMLDRKGRLIGRVEHLAEHLDPPELRFTLRILAEECDRFETVLTGGDTY